MFFVEINLKLFSFFMFKQICCWSHKIVEKRLFLKVWKMIYKKKAEERLKKYNYKFVKDFDNSSFLSYLTIILYIKNCLFIEIFK